jgi:hypothetical protein
MPTALAMMAGRLQERLLEDEAMGRGGGGGGGGAACFTGAHASDTTVADSGDGSGRWRLDKIVGYSADACVYALWNHPPAEPHPWSMDAWHVTVRVVRACVRACVIGPDRPPPAQLAPCTLRLTLPRADH